MHEQFDPTRPIYLQIMEAVKKQTLRGELAPGEPLKSVREMSKRMGVNPNTMARAYMELEREGFITTRRGTGSFITEDKEHIERERRTFVARIAGNFLDELEALGLGPAQIDSLLDRLRARAVASQMNSGQDVEVTHD